MNSVTVHFVVGKRDSYDFAYKSNGEKTKGKSMRQDAIVHHQQQRQQKKGNQNRKPSFHWTTWIQSQIQGEIYYWIANDALLYKNGVVVILKIYLHILAVPWYLSTTHAHRFHQNEKKTTNIHRILYKTSVSAT